jgi:hypothetical protein
VLLVSLFGGGAAALFAAPRAGNRPDPKGVGANLKTYESPIYIVYTDVPEDDAREAVIRMNKVAYEYHERTKNLFGGSINQQLPFYLFSKPEDYVRASGMPASAGIFTGDALMARVIRGPDGHIGSGTWHVAQHEGFHQFVHAVIRGDIPTWVNEGLAEYFAEGVFTGDGMVTGCIPAGRLRRVQERLDNGSFIGVKEMMLMTHEQWNANFTLDHYDQAWSMVHFLAMAENGKYQDAFARFLQLVGKGNPWDRAWVTAFGNVEGFEEKWKHYWKSLPDNPTLDLYTKAVVSSLTSFLGRAYSQRQTFDTFDEFIAQDARELKAAPADWLPPALYTEMKQMADQLKQSGAAFTLVRRDKIPLPQIVCVMKDGTRVVGTFSLSNGRIGKVTADVTGKSADATKLASPAPKGK